MLNALLLADGRLPTGAYSYSAGLEPAVIAGLQTQEVYAYMCARLHTVARVEAGACILAHRLAVTGAEPAAYETLEAAVDARTPSAAQRETSRSLGRALLRLARSLASDYHGVTALRALAQSPTRAVALGVLGAALSVDEAECAEVCCYEDLQSVAEAALKLLPINPMDATRWVVDAGTLVTQVVADCRELGTAAELPACSAPWMEHRAEAHAQRTRRLFVA